MIIIDARTWDEFIADEMTRLKPGEPLVIHENHCRSFDECVCDPQILTRSSKGDA